VVTEAGYSCPERSEPVIIIKLGSTRQQRDNFLFWRRRRGVGCGADAVKVIREACEEAESLDSLIKAVGAYGVAFLDRCEEELRRARECLGDVVEGLRSAMRNELKKKADVLKAARELAESPRAEVEVAAVGDAVVVVVRNRAVVEAEVEVRARGAGIDKRETLRVAPNRSEEVKFRAKKDGEVEVEWNATWPGARQRAEGSKKVGVAVKQPDKPPQQPAAPPRQEERRVEAPPQPRQAPEAAGESPPQPRPAPQPVPQSPQQPPGQLDWGEVLSVASRHALVSLVGVLVGMAVPETRSYPKRVLVEGLPHVEGRDVTYVLEDPSAVVVDDRGDYVLVRRARVVELVSQTTKKLAKVLIDDFRSRAREGLSRWSEGGRVRERDAGEEALEKIAKVAKRRAEEVAEALPRLFLVEASYGGGLFRRPQLRVYVGAFCRLDRLFFHGVDHEPARLGEALAALGLEEVEDAVVVLGSPTGWDEESKRRARGGGRLVLIDLKTGVAYCPPELADLAAALGFGAVPLVPYGEEVAKLDELLLEGKISQEVYLQEIKAVLKPPQQRS
jgi:hypothetical protein